MKSQGHSGELIAAEDCGGKAYQLQRLRAAGFPVPEFLIIDKLEIARLFREPLAHIRGIFGGLAEGGLRAAGGSGEENGLAEGGLRAAGGSGEENGLAEACLKARSLIMACDLSADENGLLAKIQERLPAGSRFAVRSSAIGEDSLQASFAGQHESFLYCNLHEISEYLKACVASAWSEHAIRYRLLKQLPIQGIEIAVIIQEMVVAQKAGVAFSVNVNGNLAESVIVAGFGPGQGIVSDLSDTDSYFVDRQYHTIRHSIQKKEKMLSHEPVPQLIDVPTENQNKAVLSNIEILKLHQLLLDAEKLLEQYADIEFVLTYNDEIRIVQLRPVTGLDPDKLIILDNTNIVESYPGITKPLSYSFASMTYQKVFQSSLKAFGVNPATFAQSEDMFANLLAHHQGRVYYRLDNWYRLVQEVYPSKSLQHSWREAVGLQDSRQHPPKFSRKKQATVFFRLAALMLTYPRWTARFFKAFGPLNLQFWSWKHKNLNNLQLWNHFNDSVSQGLQSWHYTLLNDYLAFAAVGLVRKSALRLGICQDEACTDRLFPGNSEMESRQSMVHLAKLINHIENSGELAMAFKEEPIETIIQLIDNRKFPEFSDAWEAYLERFGDRSLAELKMETQTPRSNPSLLVHVIQNNLSELSESRINQLTRTPDELSPGELVNRKLPLFHPGRLMVKIFIRIASRGLTNRENMRFCRARIHGAARAIFIEFGERMYAGKLLACPSDVFFLQLNEIEAFAKNEPLDFLSIVSARKSMFENWEKLSPPDRIVYESINYDKINQIIQEDAANSETSFTGTGVSAGIATGDALVLTEPSLNCDAAGKILVTKMTDPGWVFLMSQAAGIISEKGSLLSHTAIIGRELKIPVVVGIHRAMERVKTGEKVRMDGSTGRIEKLDS